VLGCVHRESLRLIIKTCLYFARKEQGCGQPGVLGDGNARTDLEHSSGKVLLAVSRAFKVPKCMWYSNETLSRCTQFEERSMGDESTFITSSLA
jgi:hypothetical protein